MRPGMESGTFVAVQYVSEIRLFAYSGLFLAGLAAVLTNRDMGRLIAAPWPMLAALAWCWFSLTWSADPDLSAKKLVLTTIVIWLAFYCISKIGYRMSVSILRFMLVGCLFVNLLVVFMYPAIGVHSFEKIGAAHQWRGLMGHKNVAGQISGLVIVLLLFDTKRVSLIVRFLSIAASVVFLILSQSRTSIIATVVASILGFCLIVFHGRIRALIIAHSKIVERVYIAVCFVFLTVAVWISAHIDVVLKFAQDPDALSGRTEIWQPMLQFYADHPVAGAGFGAFWLSSGQKSGDIHRTWLQDVAQGHNGYLDIAVQVGFVGLIMILFACAVMPVTMIYRMIRTGHVSRQMIALLSALLVMVLGENLSESSLFDRDTLGQVILVITIGMLVTVTNGTRTGWVRRGSAEVNSKADVVRRRRTGQTRVSTSQRIAK